ncbi:pentapeptide repeat-containing protein [Limnospira fusiformis]
MRVNIHTEILLAQRNCEPTPQLKDLLEHQRENGRTNWERIHLCGKALNGINFEGAELSRSNFQDAWLNGANLRGAVLLDTDFQGARLYKADLYNAFLISANLIGANLELANLESAIMHNADLQDADLRNADLRNADLRGVDLTQTKGLSQHQIESAILCDTKLPDYLLSAESKHLENRDCHRFN